jgi:hypothetical protein
MFTECNSLAGQCRGYSEVFAGDISGILVVFCAEYVGINYARYSEAEYRRNTIYATKFINLVEYFAV